MAPPAELLSGASGGLLVLAGVAVIARRPHAPLAWALGVFVAAAGIPFAVAGFVGTFPGWPEASRVVGAVFVVTGAVVLLTVPHRPRPGEMPWLLGGGVLLLGALALGIAGDASPRLANPLGIPTAFLLAALPLLSTLRAARSPHEAHTRPPLLALTWLTGLSTVCGLLPQEGLPAARLAGFVALTLALAGGWLVAAARARSLLAALAGLVVLAFAAARFTLQDYDALTVLFALSRLVACAAFVVVWWRGHLDA